MGVIDDLAAAYERFARLPWDRQLAGPQKVWFAIYEPDQERRLRLRIPEFELATRDAGHRWVHHDLTDAFAEWMAAHEYREAYFEDPDALDIELSHGFANYLVERVTAVLTDPQVNDDTVVALSGIGSLFGLTRVSALIERIAPLIRGRLLVFFPGRQEGSNYRLLDAHDGWNYLAVPVTANDRT